jgi:hypothetical protein
MTYRHSGAIYTDFAPITKALAATVLARRAGLEHIGDVETFSRFTVLAEHQ